MGAPGDTKLMTETMTALKGIKAARKKLRHQKVVYYGDKPRTSGDLFKNYGKMIINRSIDLFDDAMFLLSSGRLSSACIIARCVIETHAVGMYAVEEISKYVSTSGVVGVEDKILKFINSSKYKIHEQKALKDKKFDLNEYTFTEQARLRMENEAAQAVHVMNALRHLFAVEMSKSGQKESMVEIIYNGLSEWVHPSQTSLFHKYAKETQLIESSMGQVSLDARMRFECVHGVSLITASQILYEDMIQLGDIIDQFEANPES